MLSTIASVTKTINAVSSEMGVIIMVTQAFVVIEHKKTGFLELSDTACLAILIGKIAVQRS
jgi:hypothetical protein